MDASLPGTVRLRQDLVPDDLDPDRAINRLVHAVLDRTPVTEHERVRERKLEAYP